MGAKRSFAMRGTTVRCVQNADIRWRDARACRQLGKVSQDLSQVREVVQQKTQRSEYGRTPKKEQQIVPVEFRFPTAQSRYDEPAEKHRRDVAKDLQESPWGRQKTQLQESNSPETIGE
jgi:hypothetical protein